MASNYPQDFGCDSCDCNPCNGSGRACSQPAPVQTSCSGGCAGNCGQPSCACPPPVIIERPVVRNALCVVPVHGVISMPEQGHVAMPVEGAEVPNNAYYRKLIKCGKLRQVDCETGCATTDKEWTGRKCGSFQHDFCGEGVLNIWALLEQSQSGAASVSSIQVSVTSQANDSGLLLMMTGNTTQSYLKTGESSSWSGGDDGLGNLTPASDFTLVLASGDCVTVSWSEIN